jgi:hypothetical protein
LTSSVELASIRPTLSAAILCRPHTAGGWLDTVQEYASQAMLMYDTMNMHWLREARRSQQARDVLMGANGESISIP